MKRILALLLVFVVLAVGQDVALASTGFTDLEGYSWAEEDITTAVERGVVAGVGDGRFEPARMVSRAEFARMLVCTFQAPQVAPSNASFSDVSPNSWAYTSVETAKDFLTGYANPFGGLPAFHPTEPATREDIAVALVKMMGLTEADAVYENYAFSQFSDGDQISPSLVGYINVAAEQGLIAGKGDGRFDPQGNASRAETVVLINRATKDSVADINQDVALDVKVLQKDATVTLSITVDQGTAVTVEGENVKLSPASNSQALGGYVHTFAQEGSKTFTIEATKMGKKTTLTKAVTYQLNAPVITVFDWPTTSKEKTVVIKGQIVDPTNHMPSLTINGEDVVIRTVSSSKEQALGLIPTTEYVGQWMDQVELKEGTNTVEIVVKSSNGKTVTERKTIEFAIGAPVITITDCPRNSDTSSVEITGSVRDPNDERPEITINGKIINMGSSGLWSYKMSLKEGVNTLLVTAKNKQGKTATETRNIEFNLGGPNLEITQCPPSSDKDIVTITGRVRDINDSNPLLTINGKALLYNGSWSCEVSLREGANTIEIVAKNNLGKTTKETRIVEFIIGGPKLEITECPTNSDKDSVTIKGEVSDLNDRSPSVSINGKPIMVYYGSWSYEPSLKEGTNTFEIVARNSLGKTTKETRTIELIIGGPTLEITQCPVNSDKSSVTIEGRVSDLNDHNPSLTINGKAVMVSYGSWSYEPTLKEGTNTFEIIVKNSLGKTTSETRTVNYLPETV